MSNNDDPTAVIFGSEVDEVCDKRSIHHFLCRSSCRVFLEREWEVMVSIHTIPTKAFITSTQELVTEFESSHHLRWTRGVCGKSSIFRIVRAEESFGLLKSRATGRRFVTPTPSMVCSEMKEQRRSFGHFMEKFAHISTHQSEHTTGNFDLITLKIAFQRPQLTVPVN
ncbi:hypothetical protein [Agrobacterium pusense]|uniref:Uncharacterized protein n=1 Tax=Agrobacterium pusense TaxID=648995 RepID=U4PQH0_9HYPH|nr:hypothetical protein [Agrobacterium pusense]CDI07363.1 protein of unknown function [Agrobacterium pusense]